jgi:HAMP domain-containing protein
MREKYIGAAAAAAVAIGAGLAFAAWRRARRDRDLIHGVVMYERPIPADVICD